MSERKHALLLSYPYQDATGQVKQPRWEKCWELWQEFSQALNRSELPKTGNGGEVQ